MKATLGEKPFDDPNYLFEEKLDGYRVIAVIDEEVNLYSRNGENMNRKFTEIRETLESVKTPCILDGEVVAYDKKGKAAFQLIQNDEGRSHLTYHVFDILNLNGISTVDLPLIERKKFLKKVIKDKMRVKVTKVVKGKGKKLFKRTLKNTEGIIAKKVDSKYYPGERSVEWVKIKNSLREEFVIGGVTKPNGNRTGFGSLIVGYFKKKKLVYVGHIGTGFDERMIESLTKSFKRIKRKDSPFDNYEGDKTVQFWVEPIIVCEASFAEWTRDNMIRQATFLGIRTDKLPKQVDKSDSILESIISKPEKILFPQKKYTKLDLAKYYLEVAPIILPYLKDRPQNMNRQPDGIKGISFYHKDIEFELPDYVETYDYKRDKPKEQKDGEEIDKEITYILCQNAETLVFMANLGCIEVNPWLSRVENIDRPDFLVFDIDPSGVDFEIVVKVAKDLYKFLEKLEIQPFVKTSGKRGIHLYSFLNQKYSYDESRNFAQLVAKIFEQKYPGIISLERSPKDRKNKIYIDYLQNRKGQTTAAVYSARPTESASVSTPLKFSELNNKLDPLKFDIKNTLKRIDKVGDLWEEIWERETDLAKSLRLLQKN